MRASLELPRSELARLERSLAAERRLEVRVAVRSLNKIARKVATATGRQVAAERRLPVRIVRKRLRLRRASRRRPEARLWFGTVPVRVADLGALTQTRRGARAGRRPLIVGAFVARMPSGHRGIFRRRGPSRLPIDEQTVSLMPHAERALRTRIASARAAVVVEYRRLLALNHARQARRLTRR